MLFLLTIVFPVEDTVLFYMLQSAANEDDSIKVDKWDGSAVKNALDDAVKEVRIKCYRYWWWDTKVCMPYIHYITVVWVMWKMNAYVSFPLNS